MGERSAIEWTDATFNAWSGCTRIAPGCDHCYAEARMDTRLGRVQWGAGQPRLRTSPSYWRKPVLWNARPYVECTAHRWRGEKRELVFGTECPYRRSWETCAVVPTRRRVFCASLSDVFDNEVDPAWRADLFDLIKATPNLDWLLLTKRIGNVQGMLPSTGRPFAEAFPHVWIGATMCTQPEFDRDLAKLLAVSAAVRFISAEPLLGPVTVPGLGTGTSWCPICKAIVEDAIWKCHESEHGVSMADDFDPARHCASVGDMLHWVIVGGESGAGARPMHPAWARSLRDQCAASGVAMMFKQWGSFHVASIGEDGDVQPPLPLAASMKNAQIAVNGSRTFLPVAGNAPVSDVFAPGNVIAVPASKHATGRRLDGREHHVFPQRPAVCTDKSIQ